jgi:Rrf2 family nitric oxide-sensitive transcriptional repressor
MRRAPAARKRPVIAQIMAGVACPSTSRPKTIATAAAMMGQARPATTLRAAARPMPRSSGAVAWVRRACAGSGDFLLKRRILDIHYRVMRNGGLIRVNVPRRPMVHSGPRARTGAGMRLTTKTNLAMRVLMACAVNRGQVLRKHDLAQAVNASEAHLAVVINQLGRLGFLTTVRGRNGGLKLRLAPEDISVGKVFRLFEGGMPLAECFDREANTCPLSSCCRLSGSIGRALEAFFATLDGVTLADLVEENAGLARILQIEPA